MKDRKCSICGKTNDWADHTICHKCGYQKYKKGTTKNETYRTYQKEYNARIKKEVLGHYGGKCACCGETILFFLTIDHINGGGVKHRKEVVGGGGLALYHWLKKNGYPEGFQVLCFNCNSGRSANGGICPHKEATLNTPGPTNLGLLSPKTLKSNDTQFGHPLKGTTTSDAIK